MVTILLTLNAIICVVLILLILLQKSDPNSGGMFGGAGSGSSNIARNPLARPTAILAALFLLFSILAAVLNKGGGHGETVMTGTIATPTAPALPEAALLGTTVTATTAPISTTIITTPTTATSPTE